MLVQLPLLQVDSTIFSRPLALQIPDETIESEIYSLLARTLSISSDAFYLAFTPDRSSAQVRLRLPGGKGGFGSQLRAQGNKMSSKKRAGNYEACRDLSGQRLRSQKHAKLITDYLEGEPERLSAREKEIRGKMERHLEAPHKKVMFNDPNYLKTSRKIVDGTEDAVRSLFADSETESDEEDGEGASNEENEDNESDKEGESNQDNEYSEYDENNSIEALHEQLSTEDLNSSHEDEKAPL